MTNNVCIVLLSSCSFIFNNTSSVIVLWIWVHGRKFTLPFCFVLLCIWGHCFQVQAPGGLYLEGRFNGGFFALRFWGAYFRNFTVIDNPDPVGWITKTFSALASFSNSFRWICFGLLCLKRSKTHSHATTKYVFADFASAAPWKIIYAVYSIWAGNGVIGGKVEINNSKLTRPAICWGGGGGLRLVIKPIFASVLHHLCPLPSWILEQAIGNYLSLS